MENGFFPFFLAAQRPRRPLRRGGAAAPLLIEKGCHRRAMAERAPGAAPPAETGSRPAGGSLQQIRYSVTFPAKIFL